MKILSRFKDYYDHLVGTFGEDPKLVLDRTKFTPKPYTSQEGEILTFYIGNYKVQGYFKNGKINFANEIEQYSEPFHKFFSFSNKYNEKEYYRLPGRNYYAKFILKQPQYLSDDICPTYKENCP